MKLAFIKFISRMFARYLRFKGAIVGNNAIFGGLLFVQNRGGKGSITIGDDVTIHSMRVFNGVLTNRTALVTHPGGRLVLGDRCGLSGTTIIASSSVTVGEDTLIGADTIIMDNDMHYQSPDGLWQDSLAVKGSGKPIRIGNNCFIGMRSIILKGVTIGDSCVIGAGTVLAKDVPDNHMAYGNPAVIKPRRAVQEAS